MALGSIAEDWTRIYSAFEQINFKSYDFDSVKSALLDYLRIAYPENFNDYVESSELIMMIELFAYVAEQLAYRVDMLSHENFITTAERKQSILRLAKLISYAPKRCISGGGFVKIDSISVTEDLRDVHGNLLKNRIVKWNDPNNPFWKDQFIQLMNRVTSTAFGAPVKAMTVDSVDYSLYALNNALGTFTNNVIPVSAEVGADTINLEVTSADLDATKGIIKARPDSFAQFNVVFANDGFGDASPRTGYLLPIVEGMLSKIEYTFADRVPNRVLELGVINVNNDDVTVNQIVDGTSIPWEEVKTISGTNLYFNVSSGFKKFEVETLENDQVRLIFGDDNYAEIPVGSFEFFVRQSVGRAIYVPKNAVQNQSVSFKYISPQGLQETCTISFSLIDSIQDGAPSESIERIRQIAPTTYYAQNRMVNGQDYNTLLLRDQSILKLKSVNRTFAGQPKYITWNDASGTYQNVKLFGDDLSIFYHVKDSTFTFAESSRTLIDNVLEPQILSKRGIANNIIYNRFKRVSAGLNLRDVVSIPRKTFIEQVDINGTGRSIQEKTEIQGQLDRHFYGEPDSYVNILNPVLGIEQLFAVVDSDVDKRIWDTDTPLVVTDATSNTGYSVINANGSNYQLTGGLEPEFGLRFNPAIQAFNADWIILVDAIEQGKTINDIKPYLTPETLTIECVVESDANPRFLVTSSVGGQLGILTANDNWVENVDQGFKLKLCQQPTVFGRAKLGDAMVLDVSPAGIRYRQFLTPTDAELPDNVNVVAASTGNVDITGALTALDGVSLSAGDLVLLMDQVSPLENGIYSVDASNHLARVSSVADTALEYDYVSAERVDLNAPPDKIMTNAGQVTLASWMRIALHLQADTSKNGIYLVSVSGTTVTLTRVSAGFRFSTVHVTGGSVNGGKILTLASNINLHGRWELVLRAAGANALPPTWDIKVVRAGHGTSAWTIVIKDYKVEVHSPTTRFWFNDDAVLIDRATKRRVRDNIQLLKSNLDATRTRAIGENRFFDVVGLAYSNSGDVEQNKLEVSPTDFYALSKQRFISGDSVQNDMHLLLTLLMPDDYCYFSVDASTLNERFIPRTTIVDGRPIHQKTFTNTSGISGMLVSRQPVMIISGNTDLNATVQLTLSQSGAEYKSNQTQTAGSHAWLIAVSENLDVTDQFRLEATITTDTEAFTYVKTDFGVSTVNSSFKPSINIQIDGFSLLAAPSSSSPGAADVTITLTPSFAFLNDSNTITAATINAFITNAKNYTFNLVHDTGHQWLIDSATHNIIVDGIPPSNNFNARFTITLMLGNGDTVSYAFNQPFAVNPALNQVSSSNTATDDLGVPQSFGLDFNITDLRYTLINTVYTRALVNNQLIYKILDPNGVPIEISNPGTFRVDGLPITQHNFQMINVDNFLIDSAGSLYTRRPGREGLDFLWQHFAPADNLIDPSTTNIIDIFVITEGYYRSVQNYLSGATSAMPAPPSSVALKRAYAELLQNKMISDTVIMNSGRLKLIFGQKAQQEFQARLKIVKNPSVNLSDNQVKLDALGAVNEFFDLANWDFGKRFYATELISYLHQKLGSKIVSVVLVPTYEVNSFGSLFSIIPDNDEILVSCLTIDDIDIVQNLDPVTLRQKF